MNILNEKLDKNIGMKFNDLVYYGLKDVAKAINNSKELFADTAVSKLHNSQMLYGYNSLGNPIKLGFEGDLIKRIIISTEPIKNKRFKALISYDGSNYNGFQIQKGQPTIQGELTRVISDVNNTETLVQGASRTDAGVHALNYVFHFDTDKNLSSKKWREYLNHQLPEDILVKSVEEVNPLFHSRYDVYKKRYIYKICTGEKNPLKIKYQWFVKDINFQILEENLKHVIGTFDFSSFCKGNPDSKTRTIYHTELIKNDDEIILVFEGNGFLRYMIRIMVYALIQISKGTLNMNIEDIIKEKSRFHTKNLAPANGLYLEEIIY